MILSKKSLPATIKFELLLKQQYGRNVLFYYRSLKKIQQKLEFVKLDIRFLKVYRAKDIIPKFLQYKMSNQRLLNSKIYRESQRKFLTIELNSKYKLLSQLKRQHCYSYYLLKDYIPVEIFTDATHSISTQIEYFVKIKHETHEKKLSMLIEKQKPVKSSLDTSVVNNLSSRNLKDEERECLAHGLEFGLLPKGVNDINMIINVEEFFHRITNIHQEHKKTISDLKETKTTLNTDIRILNTKEMALSSKLRSLIDSFKFQAEQYRKEQNDRNDDYKKYQTILKDLRSDKTIVIIRPDKECGVVLMDRSQYRDKMNKILHDQTKFKILFEDPTIKRENSLTYLLRKLHKKRSISDEFYYKAKLIGSNPGRLYGLPKIHKKDMPLRPVLSAIGTFSYRHIQLWSR